MSTHVEDRANRILTEMRERIAGLTDQAPRITDFAFSDLGALADAQQPVVCAGNQHQCEPQFFVPAMDQRFSVVLTGTGDSVIVGHHNGPRALLWQNTSLEGEHPELGKISVHLEPSAVNAGTLVPVVSDSAFPAVNRNTYFFVFNIDSIGEIVSDRPAIVEALIDEVPPTGAYVFRNGPLNFHRRGDPDRTTIAVLEAAVTDVKPE